MDVPPDVTVEERLIAVSVDDVPVGPITKVDCHAGKGVLHRAFSLFLFNREGEVLLQRRSALKPLWPGYWANSCCSHPRWGEALVDAVIRRAWEELGIALPSLPTWQFSFVYHAQYNALGSEHEFCHVYTAVLDATEVDVDPNEISAYRWVKVSQLDMWIKNDPHLYSPWLRIEWPRLKGLCNLA